MAEIRIKQIAKNYGSYQALQSIDIAIKDREFMVLLGASGCGKTTLLRIIAGLEQPLQGEVWIGDKRVDHLPPRQRGIAMVFQNYAIFPHLTVYENIAFGLRMAKIPKKIIDTRVHLNAQLLHIEQLLHRYSGELSGGQRQRVAVARALAMEPDVILMDEPLSNLDALLRLEMRTELKGVLAQSNTTAVYVTHDQVEAMSLADTIAVMHQGQIVQADTPMQLYRNPATQFVASFIGNPPMNFLQADKTTELGKWLVAGYTFTGPKETNNNIHFAIRPEDIQLDTSGIAAKVQVIEPLGPHLLVTCDVNGSMFRAILESESNITAGQVIHLMPQRDRIRWYDPDTQQNLIGSPV